MTVVVDEQAITSIFAQSQFQEDVVLRLLTADGQTILDNGKKLDETEKNILAYSQESIHTGWKLSAQLPLAKLYQPIYQTIQFSIIMVLICVVLGLLVTQIIAMDLVNPVRKLIVNMKHGLKGVKPGELKHFKGAIEIVEINETFISIMYEIEQLIKQLVKQEKKKKDAEIRVLQNQLSPHFLYNTLNSIRWMAMIQKQDNIKEMVDSLNQLLNYSVRGIGEPVPLEEEIAILKNYVNIQKVRYQNFSLIIDLEPGVEQTPILKFLLQPFIENALIHGLVNTDLPGTIQIEGRKVKETIHITVSDNGVGMSPERLEKVTLSLYGKDPTGEHFGLRSVHERIQLHYGEAFGVRIESEAEVGTKVFIRLPVRPATEQEEGAGLQSLIDWESHGYVIAGVFKNGEEALQAAMKERFDIILTDISMPVMDGFALIDQLKKHGYQINIVILSSYNEFEYLRKAIQLGVKDYISKYQLEPEELIRVLKSLPHLNHPNDKPRNGSVFLEGNESVDSSADLQTEKADLLRNTRQRDQLEDTQEAANEGSALKWRLQAQDQVVCWIALKPYPREKAYLPSEQKAMQVLAEEIFKRLRNLEFFGWDQEILHGAIYFTEQETIDQQNKAIMERMAELQKTMMLNINIALIVGVSLSGNKDHSLLALRQNAQEAMELAFYQGPGLYRGAQDHRAGLPIFSEKEWLDYYKQVKQHIQNQQFDELYLWFAQLAERKGTEFKPAEWLRLGHIIAMNLMDMVIERYHLHADKIEQHFGLLWPLPEYIERARDYKELSESIRTMIGKVKDMITLMHANQGWLLKVKAYVETHYAEPIHLEDVAELVNFNENYLSQRFRQETGEVFSDYLTNLRIQKAMLLYQETELSTEEIAERVGYTNANYFSKVFKKATGKTISEFKQLSKENELH
ncbi:unnamed protein product [Aphanomyces euteiches]